MYVRIRGWESVPGKDKEFQEALKEIVGWIRDAEGCVSADMVKEMGVGQDGKYFSLIRYDKILATKAAIAAIEEQLS